MLGRSVWEKERDDSSSADQFVVFCFLRFTLRECRHHFDDSITAILYKYAEVCLHSLKAFVS